MVSAIIVAAGRGVRMNEKMRKQYLLLAGRPILGHTLMVFDECHFIDKIFLVVPEVDFDYCRTNILVPLKLKKKPCLVPGGARRQDSVYNGLLAADSGDESTVVIHDGVRPFLTSKQVTECINGAKEYGGCILGIPASDTLKSLNSSGNIDKTIERDPVWLAQTPQAFQYAIIRKAHENARQKGYAGTDDAFLVERLGEKIKMVNGSRFNIKITTQEDLMLAKAILETREWKR